MEARGQGDKTPVDAADSWKFDTEEYVLRKRLPRRLPKRPNDVYVSRKTDFRAQLARLGLHQRRVKSALFRRCLVLTCLIF